MTFTKKTTIFTSGDAQGKETAQQSTKSDERERLGRVPPPRPDPPCRTDEAHYLEQVKRFKAGGHAPPAPPVGGQFLFTSNTVFNLMGSKKISEGADSLENLTNIMVHHPHTVEGTCQQTSLKDFSIY